MFVNGVIAVIVAYLLGSIPSAYIVTRLQTGQDIRKLGRGNVGAYNVLKEVGRKEALAVIILDVLKGASAVYFIPSILAVPLLFVLATGLAAVVGHIWPVFLKFRGGKGLATTLGILSVLMTRDLMIALAISVLLVVITHNPVLSLNLSLLSVPVSAWLLEKSMLLVVFSLILALILVLHFLPTAKTALAKAGSKENLISELFRADRTKKSKKAR